MNEQTCENTAPVSPVVVVFVIRRLFYLNGSTKFVSVL